MHLLFIAVTTTTSTTTGTASGGGRFVLPIILLGLGVTYLLFVRPQRRKQRMQQSMQSELSIGDEVLTAGGVYGTVTRVGDDEVGVEIAPNVEIRLARRAIAVQLTEHADPEADATDDTEEPSAPDAESGEDNPG
jgi:preprotein translocase subunit YajC